jgi:uncharacterized Rmd1/YagE family protein
MTLFKNYKKSTYKRRFKPKKWTKKFKPYKRMNPNEHLHKRTQVQTLDITNTQAFNSIADVHNTLSTFPNATDLTNAYDEYKLAYVKKKFVFDMTASTTDTNFSMPELIRVFDRNDTAVLANEAEALQYSTYKTWRLDKPVTIGYYPYMIDGGLSNTAKKTGYVPTTFSTTGVALGIKLAYNNPGFTGSATVVGKLRIYTTWYLHMRTPK